MDESELRDLLVTLLEDASQDIDEGKLTFMLMSTAAAMATKGDVARDDFVEFARLAHDSANGHEPLLEVVIPEAPLSDNVLYWSPPGTSKKVLTDEGKKYLNTVKKYVTAAWTEAGMPEFRRDMMFSMDIVVRLPHVFTTSKKAKFPFVIVDTHNRGKRLADSIASTLGFDDSQHFDVRFRKCEGPSAVYVRIDLLSAAPRWPVEEEE